MTDVETMPEHANGTAQPAKKDRKRAASAHVERTKIIETDDRSMLDAIALATGIPQSELIAEGVRFLRDKYVKHK